MLPRAIARRYAVAAGHSRERLLTEPTAEFARPVMGRQPMPRSCPSLDAGPGSNWREFALNSESLAVMVAVVLMRARLLLN